MTPGILIAALALAVAVLAAFALRLSAALRTERAARDVERAQGAAACRDLEAARARLDAVSRDRDEEHARLAAVAEEARGRAERAERARDDLVAMVSHELRTPLNAVLGWARLLRSGRLDEEGTARALETIERSASAQAQIVDDLLDMARIARGELRLDVRTVDLVPVVEAAMAAVRPAAEARGIHVAAALMPGAGPVQGDPGRLQQVVWNLLCNAVKFTPPGGRVETRLDRDGDDAVIRVVDTGEGIAPELAPHLFERFRQADSSATRPHGGLGLGLALVRHVVEAHGGTVSAASAGRGKGATFTVRLPRAPRRRAPAGARSVPAHP